MCDKVYSLYTIWIISKKSSEITIALTWSLWLYIFSDLFILYSSSTCAFSLMQDSIHDDVGQNFPSTTRNGEGREAALIVLMLN